MQTITLRHGLTLTRAMYDIAQKRLAERVPEEANPTWEDFIDPGSWDIEPNHAGGPYCATLPVHLTAEHSVALVRWLEVDPGVGAKPLPYNMPYRDANEYILTGGYTVEQYSNVGKHAAIEVSEAKFIAGNHAHVNHGTFRRFTGIIPDTLSMLICSGPLSNEWSFFDPSTLAVIPAADNRPANFLDLHAHLNEL